MAEEEPECPLCNARLERGFVMDRGHANKVKPTVWVEGEPEPSFLGLFGTSLVGKRQIEIESWRCVKCGYLVQFAWAPTT